MSWEIIAGLITLLGGIAILVNWTERLSSQLATLTNSISNLSATISEVKAESKEKNNQMQSELDNHETRITILEHDKGE